MFPTECCICETNNANPIGAGEDFEYRTSADVFAAVRHNSCEPLRAILQKPEEN